MPETIQTWLNRSYHTLSVEGIHEDARLSLQVLLGFYLGFDRSYLLSHPDQAIPESIMADMDAAVKRLAEGFPLPYLLGSWEFFGMPFKVTPDVLIPRPETELLVENAICWLIEHSHIQNPFLIDIGTGSGCIPVAITANIPEVFAIATDFSLSAIKVARRNAAAHKVQARIDFVVNNMCIAINKKFHVVTANLPYIPTRILDNLAVGRHEPRLALDGGECGTNLMEELLVILPKYVNHPGLILFEFQYDQWEHMSDIAARAFPGGTITKIKDYAGKDRILRIELP